MTSVSSPSLSPTPHSLPLPLLFSTLLECQDGTRRNYSARHGLQSESYPCNSYAFALQEISDGQKRECWMWWIYPSVATIRSQTYKHLLLRNFHDMRILILYEKKLRERITEITAVANTQMVKLKKSAKEIFGFIDEKKFKECTTGMAMVGKIIQMERRDQKDNNNSDNKTNNNDNNNENSAHDNNKEEEDKIMKIYKDTKHSHLISDLELQKLIDIFDNSIDTMGIPYDQKVFSNIVAEFKVDPNMFQRKEKQKEEGNVHVNDNDKSRDNKHRQNDFNVIGKNPNDDNVDGDLNESQPLDECHRYDNDEK